LATFADLMSLLLCFFVLLISMATMDVIRFKRIAESMKDAFGVQKEIPVYDTPMGTSIIAQHFSPAPTEPTPLDDVRQITEKDEPHLKIPENLKEQLKEQLEKELQEEAEKIKEALKVEIDQGLVNVETEPFRIIIRIHEKGSFPSGSAILNAGFEPVMDKITEAVKNTQGEIAVAGHTDNIPIATNWYRSNWELSVSRAVTVAHHILKDKAINPKRIVLEGYAETRPLVDNSTPENRAKNRRVEIVVKKDDLLLQREHALEEKMQQQSPSESSPPSASP